MLKLPSWGVPTCFAPWELKGKICISPPVPFHCTGGYNIATPLWGSEMTLSTACAPDGAQSVDKALFQNRENITGITNKVIAKTDNHVINDFKAP